MWTSTFLKRPASLYGFAFAFLLLTQLVLDFSSMAQCVRIRDRRRNNAWTFAPKKDFRCLAAGQSPVTTFTITFETPVSNVTINFGDTTAFYAGPITTATRVYKTAGIFNYTITQSGCSQQIKGIFVNDYNTSCPGVGWIAPPNDSARCLPDSIVLTNFSPGMNGFTEWIINWGDLTRDTADYPSYGKKFAHKYKAGTRLCNATIGIGYRNSCNIVPCGQALSSTFGPYRFMERDSALLDQTTILICAPTNVQLKDVSKLNCRDTANRQISWTAMDGFSQPLPNPGNGIWRPRGPLGNQRITIPASMFSVVPADSNFIIRMRLRNKCGEDTAEARVRLISPANPVFSISNTNPCVGTVAQFNNLTTNPYGNVDYIWDWGDGNVDSTNNPNPTHIYLTAGPKTVVLKAQTKGFGGQICERVSQQTITIKPGILPYVGVLPTDVGCDSLTAIVKNKSVGLPNTTWTGWTFGENGTISAGSNHFPGPVSSNPNLVQILATNPGDSSSIVKFRSYGMYPVTLKATSPGCNENAGADTVRIYPAPKLRWKLSNVVLCQGEPLIIRDSSRVVATDPRGLGNDFNHILWSLKAGSDTTISSTSPLITDFDSPFQSGRISVIRFKQAGQFWVRLSVRNIHGCVVSDSVQVTVKPSAVPKLSFSRQNCDNSNLILKNLTTGNASRYIFKVFKGNGILIGQEYATFTRTDQGDQMVFLPYAPPGDSTFYYVVLTSVTYSNGDSCVVTSEPLVVKIAPTPVPGITLSPSDGCSPLNNVNVVNSSINLPQNGVTIFNWSLGSLGSFTGNAPPPLTFLNPSDVNKRDTIRICAVTGDGCSYCTEKVVVTYPQPKAEILIPDSICAGETVDISAQTVGAVSYKWEFLDYDGSSSIQPALSKIFNNNSGVPKFYTIKLTVRSSADCPFTIARTLKVNPNPDFTFQVLRSQSSNCGPLTARFIYLNTSNAVRYNWQFGNGDTLQTSSTDTLIRIFNNETAAPVQNTTFLTATSASGCKTTKSQSFNINPLVQARFRSSVDSGCTPLRVVFTDSSTMASNVRRWIVNGITLPNQMEQMSYTFQNPNLSDTVYTVKLAVRNNVGFNCVDTMERKIKVFAKPRANDLIMSPTSGCSPVTVQFQGNVENAVQYHWDFGDGTDTSLTGQNFSWTFYNTHPVSNMTYTVTRISVSAKGCTDTTRRTVTTRPQTQAVISTIQSEGCTPFTVQFSALNSVNATSYQWNFGDGSPTNTSTNPNYTFVNNSDTIQKYTVRLIARKQQATNCPDTTEKVITVYPKPEAGFEASTNVGCGPLPIVLTNNSTGGQTSFWVMSSGGISDTLFPDLQGKHDTIVDNPNFAAKTIRVDQTVISSFGCTDRTTQNIQIYPNLTAEFTVDTAGCHPHPVLFQNTSQNHLGTYTWEFGDGSISNQKNPLHLYENYLGKDTSYLVSLTSVSPVGNCIRKTTRRVHVFATPVARFRFLSDSTIQLPINTITIGNETPYRNQWTYRWTYDDGTSSTDSDAQFTHTYPLGNEDFLDTNFVMTLIATSPNGCTDTLRKTVVVKPGKPVAAFEATPREGCRPLEVQLTSTSSYARKYEWSVVDKEGAPELVYTDRDPVIFFETAGLKTVKLKVKGLGGQDSIEKVDYINVLETPRSSFYVDPAPPRTVVAPEQPAFFTPYENRLDFTYTWYFGDGDSAVQRTTSHKYASPGSYDITLKVQSPSGCFSTDTLKNGVIARGEQILTVPTAFTPNPNGSNGGVVGGDGDNDVFYPFTLGLNGIQMQIFNRWGQVVYQGNELNVGWDGYYKGKLLPADTYVYRIVAHFTNGESQTFIGDVTLLR